MRESCHFLRVRVLGDNTRWLSSRDGRLMCVKTIVFFHNTGTHLKKSAGRHVSTRIRRGCATSHETNLGHEQQMHGLRSVTSVKSNCEIPKLVLSLLILTFNSDSHSMIVVVSESLGFSAFGSSSSFALVDTSSFYTILTPFVGRKTVISPS